MMTLDGIHDIDNAIREVLAALELHLVSALRRVEAGKLPRADVLQHAARIDRLVRAAVEIADNPGDARALRDWLAASTAELPDSTAVRRLLETVNAMVEGRHDVC